MSDHVDIEFQTCYSNFLTIMYDTKEEVQRAYEIMKEGSKAIYQLGATPYSSCRVVFLVMMICSVQHNIYHVVLVWRNTTTDILLKGLKYLDFPTEKIN